MGSPRAEPCLTDALPSANGRRLGAQEKIVLFRRLFAGRPNVFAEAPGIGTQPLSITSDRRTRVARASSFIRTPQPLSHRAGTGD